MFLTLFYIWLCFPSLGYYVIPVVVYLLCFGRSLELITEEIEEPFGYDDNDLPTVK
jgi:putative membrane protein